MAEPTGHPEPILTPLEAVAALAAEHGIAVERLAVLKDGSNLSVHLVPAPVVIRVATFTARIRGDPMAWLEREVDLVSYLASVGASVMAPSDLLPAGPHVIGGWAMCAWRYVDHHVGVVPDGSSTFAAIDELHEALRGYPGELPLLNPAADDLDRAIAFGVGQGLFSPARAEDTRGRRDSIFARLTAAAPDRQALHGDAFPKNSLVTDGGIVWIDLEDCCSGPVIWDHATLLRRVDDEAIATTIRLRYGRDSLQLALDLRGVQEEVWTVIHDARQGGLISNPGR